MLKLARGLQLSQQASALCSMLTPDAHKASSKAAVEQGLLGGDCIHSQLHSQAIGAKHTKPNPVYMSVDISCSVPRRPDNVERWAAVTAYYRLHSRAVVAAALQVYTLSMHGSGEDTEQQRAQGAEQTSFTGLTPKKR